MFLELNSKRLYGGSGKEKDIVVVVVLCSDPPQNMKLGTQEVWTEKKWTKKRDACAKLLFYFLNQ